MAVTAFPKGVNAVSLICLNPGKCRFIRDNAFGVLNLATRISSATGSRFVSANAVLDAHQGSTPTNTESDRSCGPAVRLLLHLYNISVSDLQPTGPHGRLLKGDVLQYINAKKLEPKPFGVVGKMRHLPGDNTAGHVESGVSINKAQTSNVLMKPGAAKPSISAVVQDYRDNELSNMRKTIAKRLSFSKANIPHTYATSDCRIHQLLMARKKLEAEGVKTSINDFIVKACAIALQKMPDVNVIWNDGSVKQLSAIDISVAVATSQGLITPIVSRANERSVAEISTVIKELAAKAKSGKLKPEEFQGGSFTISNLGMFGIKEFSAVINPPQACILAVGASQLQFSADGKPDPVITITLAADSRIIADALAAQFLSTIADLIENPNKIMLLS